MKRTNVLDKSLKRAELVDKEGIFNIRKIQMTTLEMKFYCGCNHCGERDRKVNNGSSSDEFRWCSEKET